MRDCACRVKLRQQYVLAMHIYQGRVTRGDAPFAKERTPDDQIRLESCIFSFLATIDKVVLLARTLLADEWLQVRAPYPSFWSV
jgi:hypothetical protein